jgi:L-asparaginase type I
MKGTPMKEALRQRVHEQPDSDDCSVGLVLTGGTIGAQEDHSVVSMGGAAHVEADLLASVWPGQSKPDIAVRSPLRQLSENSEPQDWVEIANSVRELVDTEDVTGVVILHGTDTMAYTAAALSFLLSDLDRPVVLTGSNLPTQQAGSDALRNVHDALVALRALGPGVYIAFAGGSARDLPGLVHLGTCARKVQASGHAFSSINRKPVGEVVDEVFKPVEPYNARPHQSFKSEVDDRVLALRLYPGLDLDVVFAAVAQSGIRGVVIELYASATGPDTDDRFSVPRFVRNCIENGVTVVTTITAAPKTNGNVYETTLAIKEAGALFLRDMLPETATVKLMWALAQSADMDAVKRLMLTPIAGEIDASEGDQVVGGRGQT